MYNKSKHPSVIYSLNVLSQAFDSMLKDHDISQISVSELCNLANVSRNSYYNNCESLEDILDYLIDSHLDKAYANVNPGCFSAQELLFYFFQYWYNSRHFLTRLFKRGLYPVFYKKLLEMGLKKAVYSDLAGENKEMVNAYVVGGMCSVLHQWVEEDFRLPPEQVVKIAMYGSGQINKV